MIRLRRIAPIGVGYLVATKSGKSAEESDIDALQKKCGKLSESGETEYLFASTTTKKYRPKWSGILN